MMRFVFLEKCPDCNKGNIYSERSFFRIPKMNKKCSVCGVDYEKEPGFFVGAMYLSYGLGVFQAICTYLIMLLFFEKTIDLRMIPVISFVMIFFSMYNARLSRVIWIYMFKNYSK